MLLRFSEIVTLFHTTQRFFMSSAPASSWDTRVASAMMTVLQCLMFLGFYFAARHAKSTARSMSLGTTAPPLACDKATRRGRLLAAGCRITP